MADAETDAKPVDQDALVAGIDRTRAELARTIDAISDRVNPKKNVDRALEQFRRRASRVDPLIAGAATGKQSHGLARRHVGGAHRQPRPESGVPYLVTRIPYLVTPRW
jgi:hypothetical protein